MHKGLDFICQASEPRAGKACKENSPHSPVKLALQLLHLGRMARSLLVRLLRMLRALAAAPGVCCRQITRMLACA